MNLDYQVLRIRMIEEEIARRYKEQQMRCPIHLSIGQEACAVGVCAGLTANDLMVSTHRSHAHYIAKGGDLKRMLCELYGKAEGCSRGQGGSMHLVDWSVGFAGSTSIVGGTIPIGVGLAFAMKLRNESNIAVVCIGDAAVEEGVFHESANFASLHGLNVLFLCENNLYSCYTRIDQRQPKRWMKKIADAHGLDYTMGDGDDVKDVAYRARKVITSVRKGNPAFMELRTYRMVQHCGPDPDDDLNYRPHFEVTEWRRKDPVVFHEEHAKQIKAEIDEAIEYAKNAPFPGIEELGKFTYATT